MSDLTRLSAAELADSLATVRVALTGVADYTQDPFTTPFTAAHTGSDGKPVAGDAFDQQLDALQEKLGQAETTCPRRSKSEPPGRLNIEPGVEADYLRVGCG